MSPIERLMRISPRRAFVTPGALTAAFLLGCATSVPEQGQYSFQNACVAVAKSLRFTIEVPASFFGPGDIEFLLPPSEGITGLPVVVATSAVTYMVTVGCSDVPLGATVILAFQVKRSGSSAEFYAARDAVFYNVPPEEITGLPPCTPIHGPVIGSDMDTALGLVLRVANGTNQGSEPITVHLLQLAVSPAPLPVEQLKWNDSNLEALEWNNASPAPFVVYANSPPLTFDIPDQPPPLAPAPSSQAVVVLGRFISTSTGGEMRGIWQGHLGPVVSVQETTWGRVKALFRSRSR